MKINTPINPEQKEQTDAEFRRAAENQKAFIREAAEKIKRGDPLENFECNPKITREYANKFMAAVLRGAADMIPTTRPLPAGRPPKIPDDFIALFPIYADKLGSEPKALKHFAQEYQTSIESLKKRLGKAGTGYERDLSEREASSWQSSYESSKREKT